MAGVNYPISTVQCGAMTVIGVSTLPFSPGRTIEKIDENT
ncbi:unnamed protein product [marine sediment metagenome]|uniref:Uncharacterized protein n=1 Tax=marine sediment metagenome TaxID=412755 RepID=X1TJH9_9ZZZZ